MGSSPGWLARLHARLFGDVHAVEARVASAEERLASAVASLGRVEDRLAHLKVSATETEATAEEASRRLASLEAQAAASEARVDETHAKNDRLGGRLLRLESQLIGIADRPAPEARGSGQEGRLASLEARTAGLDVPRANAALKQLEARLAQLEQAGPAERLSRIAAVTLLVEREPPREVLVSVILPTRNRAELLATAVASVRAQRHQAWELLVVDDGSSDGTPEALARIDDPRVRRLRCEGVGTAAARNRALDEARGAIVAYLDDDNVMAPLWLHAVAWAFHRHPQRSLLYGAQAVQDDAGAEGGGPLDRRLWIRFEPWDRQRLERGNFIDMGALAHRRGLPEARFDERATQLEDWDLLLRLTRAEPPLELPVVCGTYRSDAPGRVSRAFDPSASLELIRAKVEAARNR